MPPTPPPYSPQLARRNNRGLLAVTVAFAGMVALLLAGTWGRPIAQPAIPLVDPTFLETTPWRQSYADLVRAKEDLSDFDCYVCHEKNEPPPLRFDAANNLLIPDEHANIVMGHGSHNRNNLCFNCHNPADLTTFYVRDGHSLQFAESPQLCGSCHGPTLRDWDAGAHGRTSGHWDRARGPIRRLDCVNCHNPHAPRIPTRAPAPAPHPRLPHGPAAAHPSPVPTH